MNIPDYPFHLFPLSVGGKIALILIAIALGIIWSMLQWPEFWKARLRKEGQSQFLKDGKTEKSKKK